MTEAGSETVSRARQVVPGLIGTAVVLGAIALLAWVFGRGGGGGFSPPDDAESAGLIEVDQARSSPKLDVVSALQRPGDERHPVALVDLAAVDAHADGDGRGAWPVLRSEGGLRPSGGIDCISGPAERRRESVPTGAEHVPVVHGDRVTEKRVVSRQRPAHRVGLVAPQSR